MNNKDIIYVDIDDEITAIIDKVRSSSGRVVALVLPKRASVFQSVVNMKLLKRNAESAKKHLVLITTEAGLMPLAGAIGLYVAATPQSKPEVPSAVPIALDVEEIIDDATLDGGDKSYTMANAGGRAIGELAGVADGREDIEKLHVPDAPDEQYEIAKKQKVSKDKNLKVPSFNKFRLRLFMGIIMLILVIAGLYAALVILPKASIAIATQSSGQNVSITMTLNPSAQTLDAANLVTPAKIEQQQKTTSQQVVTTGQQNNGTSATGNVTMTAQECAPNISQPSTVTAGTGVSVNGLTFITQRDTQFSFTSAHGNCVNYQATSATNITAQSSGAKYNVAGATFAIAGRSDVSASGSTSGGTDNIIHTVVQADIDSAKQKLGSQDASAIQTSLEQALRGDGMYPLAATFNAATPIITTSNNVGDQADSVTITEAVTYTMYGAKQSDLDVLVKNAVAKQINIQDQSILQDGLGKAVVTVVGSSVGTEQVSLQATAIVGPNINVADIKKQAAGKKVGDVKALVNAIPGVTSVDVRFSPFWVGVVPTNTSKVTVTVTGVK